MKLRYLFLAAVLVVSGCSRHSFEEQEGEGGRRPGGATEEVVAPVTAPYFADGNPERVVAGSDGSADVVLTLARDNYLEAGEATATVSTDGGSRATAVFAAHKGLAEVSFRIAATTVFSIEGDASDAPGPRTWRVEVVLPEPGEPTAASGLYIADEKAVRVSVEMKRCGETVHICVSGPELERDLTVDGDDVRLDGVPLYNNVKNTARADCGFYAVLVDDGGAEYMLLDGYDDEGYGEPEAWTLVDGWIVGHVAFESYLENPENAPWTVWVQRGDGCLRVLDLYHGKSLTARYNMASPGAFVTIKLDEGRAVVERQPAGFAHPDIFNYELEIAGEGIYDGKGEIYIRDPQYSDSDGNMTGWAVRQATRMVKL